MYRQLTPPAILIVGISLAYVFASYRNPEAAVTRSNLERIEVGMSIGDCHRIFGRPADTRCQRAAELFVYEWIVEADGKVVIEMRDNQVVGRHWMPSNVSISEKLDHWLKSVE